MKAFVNGRIFTGSAFITDHCLLVEGDTITGFVNEGSIPPSSEITDLRGGLIVPAFIDLQLYGGNGLLFSEFPSVASIKATYDSAIRGGATKILPTIATHTNEKMLQAIDAVREYQQMGLPGVIGLHLEGPFINPLKKGAHAVQYIRTPTLEEVKRMIDFGKGIIKMITLAPEVCSDEVISFLVENNVIVSAGHSNASYEEAMNGFSRGISCATHLYNAMSSLQHRAPGMVGAIFDSEDVMCSVIADGHHVDFAAIRIAKQIKQDRLFLITDAVTENNEGMYKHRLNKDKYELEDGTLSGSALTMAMAVKNCVEQVRISLDESLRMASLYPAQLLGLEKMQGTIEINKQANLVWLDDSLDVKGVYTGGELTVF